MNTSASSPEDSSIALLSNRGRYTLFKYGDTCLTIIAPAPLDHYLKVTKWDNGYIAVLTKYKCCKEAIEEYIDLVPTLRNLYMDPEKFCSKIKNVVVANG